MMDRHGRVDRVRRILRVVQRHLDGRAHAVRRKALRFGMGVGVALHRLLVGGGIGLPVCLGLRRGVAGDRLAGLRVHMMGCHRRVDHLRLALLHLKHHGIGAGGAVGIERHKHFARADKLVAGRYQRRVRHKAASLCRHRLVKAVHLVARKAVGDTHRAAGGADRLIRRQFLRR